MALVPRDVRVLTNAVRSRSDGRTAVTAWSYWSLRGAVAIGLLALTTVTTLAWVVLFAESAVVAIELWLRRRAAVGLRLLDGMYTAGREGVFRVSAATESLVRWSAIDHISVTTPYVLIHFGGTAWIIPTRCFASIAHRDEFLDAIRAHHPPRSA